MFDNPRSRSIVALIVGALLLLGAGANPVSAQLLEGIADGYSPLISWPRLLGEAKGTPIFVGIESGTNTLGSFGLSWGLRDSFNMKRSYLFIDSMARFQLNRFSLRVHYEPREFVGQTNFRNNPYLYNADARLDFSGVRLGLDVDLFQWGRSRIGVNVDYYLYRPIFTESIQTNAGGKKMIGETPATIGVHAMYIPTTNFYGVGAVFEVRAGWPVRAFSTTDLTDLELSAGLKGPETVLGSVALKGGYRRTTLNFSADQLYNGALTSTDLDVVLGGWFGELVYYY